MESTVENEIIETSKLSDAQINVDFSLLMGDIEDDEDPEDYEVRNDQTSTQSDDDGQFCDDSTSDSGDDNDITDIQEAPYDENLKKTKDLVEEDEIQTIRRDLHNVTCDQLDKTIGNLEKINSTIKNKEESESASDDFEFAIGDVSSGTISRKAELISRSDSEYQLLQSLKTESGLKLNAEVHIVGLNEHIEVKKDDTDVMPVETAENDAIQVELEKRVDVDTSKDNEEDTRIDVTPGTLIDTQKTGESSREQEHLHVSSTVEDDIHDSKSKHELQPSHEDHNNTSNGTSTALLTDNITTEGHVSPKGLSPKTWRKRAIRLPAGKRYKHTVLPEDILAAYDIIDRSEMKQIEQASPNISILSLSHLKTKLRRVWSTERKTKIFNSSPSDKSVDSPLPLPNTVIQFSVEKTADGEPMQVITLSPVVEGHGKEFPDGNDRRKSNMVIYVDNISDGENDIEFASDIDSDLSVSDFEGSADFVDSIGRNKSGSYNISHDMVVGIPAGSVVAEKNEYNVKQIENEEEDENNDDDVSDLPKSNSNKFKGPSRESKSFGGAERAKPDVSKSRRITLDLSQLPSVNFMKNVIPMDKNRLEKKPSPTTPFPCLTDGYPMVLPSYPSDRRSLIALEVYTTERTFVRGLEIIVLLFKTRIEIGGYLDAKEIQTVFSNIIPILEFNKIILEEIFDRISSWSDEQCIGDIFVQHKNEFKMYAEYCKSYDSGEALIKQRLKKNKNLESLLNSCYTNPVCKPGLTLQSYLITIIQRIPRYILLIRDLLKRTPSEHPDHQNLTEAISGMEKVASFLNDQLKQAQCQKALEALQTQITGLRELYIPGRNLVHEGAVCLLTSKKTYQCVLFNDLLVFAVKYKQSEVEFSFDLKTVWFEDLQTLDPQTTKNDAIGIYTPDRPYTMYVGSSNEKKIWLKHLRKAIITYLYPDNEQITDVDLERRESCSHTYKDGSVYMGTYVNSKRHGEGVMMWPNQMTYRGGWLDDERNGHGILEYVSGEVYEGAWKDHKQDGLGTFKYANGDTLSGQWKHGLRHGEIFVNYKNGDKFAGDWMQDCINGQGQLICINGLSYEGQWRKNLMHGRGKLKLPDGSQYSGYLMRGKFHGKGELTYSDGSEYKGEFERGERCGEGIFKVPGGNSYNGQWMHDMKDGRGKMFFANGDEYEGLWVQDMRTGQGIMFYSCGGSYRGQWINEMRHGSGIIEYKDGSSYDGEWSNDKMCGSGTFKYPDGNMFRGRYQDNVANGKGILTKPGGWYCDGLWQQGKQNGKCLLKDTFNQYSYEGDWVHGLRDGMGIETSGYSVYVGPFVDDLRHGQGKETLSDGTTYVGHWQYGQKHGKGVKKLVIGLHEEQFWFNGCLVHSPIQLTPRELPVLQRW